MTEGIPINQGATEQRLIEELTGSSVPPKVPEPGAPVEPGDPEPEVQEKVDSRDAE